MASQIESMFTSIHSKIDEEYSRIMTTFHQDISNNLSPDDFTDGYGKVDLKNSKFKSHPEGGWFIYIIESGYYNNDTISYGIDNYGNNYKSGEYNIYNGIVPNSNLKIDNSLYKFPNFLIDSFKSFNNINKLNDIPLHYLTNKDQYGNKHFNESLLKEYLSIFQNLAKEYHDRFVIYKDLFKDNKLKEYNTVLEDKKLLENKILLLEENNTKINKEMDDLKLTNIELEEKHTSLSEEYDEVIANRDFDNEEWCNKYNKLNKEYNELVEEYNELDDINTKLKKDNTKYIETISVLNEKIFQLKKHIADLSVAQNTSLFD